MTKIKEKRINVKSIKGRMILLFSILILLSFVVVAFIAIASASKALTEAGERSLQLAAEEASDLTRSKMETQLRTLEMTAQRKDITDMDWEYTRAYIRKTNRQDGFYCNGSS